MPNNLENNDSIIKKIVIENNGTYDQANIGTSAEYVDYNNTSVADTLDNIQQQLTRVIQQLTNNTEQIAEMDETVGNARKAINKINLMQNQIEHLSQDIGNQVQKNINNTTFFTKNIIWQDNLERTLRSVLGNLINLPLQATNLRDWIEKISAMGGNGGSSPGGGGGGGGGDHILKQIGSYSRRVLTIEHVDESRIGQVDIVEEKTSLIGSRALNISNWTKNLQSFPQFDNSFSDGANHLTYTGGSGYERIYFPVTLSGKPIRFEFDFKSPTGFQCLYGSNQAYAFLSTVVPAESGTALNAMSGVLGKVAYDNSASDTVKHYTIDKISTLGTVYMGFDFGYIEDGVQTVLDFNNIEFSEIEEKIVIIPA